MAQTRNVVSRLSPRSRDAWDFGHEDGSGYPPAIPEKERDEHRMRKRLVVILLAGGYGSLACLAALIAAGSVSVVAGTAAAGILGPVVGAASVAVAYYFRKDATH